MKPTIHIFHGPGWSAVSDFEVNETYAKMLARAINHARYNDTNYVTGTSTELLITRLRLGVKMGELNLVVTFANESGEQVNTQVVEPDGMIGNWTGHVDTNMNLLLELIG